MSEFEFIFTEETPHETLQRYIENMDEYQARLVLSFIKKLFNLAD
jgi:hypothetical protein